jgi:hypothetical protein
LPRKFDALRKYQVEQRTELSETSLPKLRKRSIPIGKIRGRTRCANEASLILAAVYWLRGSVVYFMIGSEWSLQLSRPPFPDLPSQSGPGWRSKPPNHRLCPGGRARDFLLSITACHSLYSTVRLAFIKGRLLSVCCFCCLTCRVTYAGIYYK